MGHLYPCLPLFSMELLPRLLLLRVNDSMHLRLFIVKFFYTFLGEYL
jgi:hypothetical protein